MWIRTLIVLAWIHFSLQSTVLDDVQYGNSLNFEEKLDKTSLGSLNSTTEESLLEATWKTLFKKPYDAIRDQFYALTNFNFTLNAEKTPENEHINSLQSGLDQMTERETARQLQELYRLQNPKEEIQDEIYDLEIFKSVYLSVLEHKQTWGNRLVEKLIRRRVKRDEEIACFGELGCFRDEGPFDYFDMLPNSPEEINTQFLLYTKENPTRQQYLHYQNISAISETNFRHERKTIVIIHGFGSSCGRVWVREMRDTFLKMENVNVICVEWVNGATTPNYVRAASNTRLVGSQVAVLLGKMVKIANLSLDNVHLVGFSLGAHVSGYTGQRLPGIGRISGLDPAGPLFESFPPNMRLDAGDAKFVDVIHTNADSLLWGGLGAYDAMGHVDFYPNGGRVQKGCANLFVGGVSDILWPKEGDGRYLCNHRRGYKYFMESVVPVCKFPAFACKDYDAFLRGDCFPCSNCGNMGYYANKAPGRGKMYLMTRDTEPFCANQYKVEIWHSGGPPATESVSTQGQVYVTFVNHDGKNETIEITRDTGKKMEAGSRTISIVVPHVALSNIVSLQVEYRAYRGWLSAGFNRWAIDKVSIMDSFGKIQSFCHRGLTLESGLTMLFPLVPGDCNPRELTLHPLPVLWPRPIADSNQVIPFTPTTPTTISPKPTQTKPEDFGKDPQVLRPTPVESAAEQHLKPKPTTIEEAEVSSFNISQNNKTTEVNGTFGDHSMTEEEYIAWKQAPPPNLDVTSSPSNQKINFTGPSKFAPPFNRIPSPLFVYNRDETKIENSDNENVVITYIPSNSNSASTENSLLNKLDFTAQDKMITVSEENDEKETVIESLKNHKNNENESYQQEKANTGSHPRVKINYFLPENAVLHPDKNNHKFNDSSDTFRGIVRQSSDHEFLLNIKTTALETDLPITDEVPYNSLVDGEIPFKERARSIKFGTSPNSVSLQNNADKVQTKNGKETKNQDTTQGFSNADEFDDGSPMEQIKLKESIADLFAIHEKIKANSSQSDPLKTHLFAGSSSPPFFQTIPINRSPQIVQASSYSSSQSFSRIPNRESGRGFNPHPPTGLRPPKFFSGRFFNRGILSPERKAKLAGFRPLGGRLRPLFFGQSNEKSFPGQQKAPNLPVSYRIGNEHPTEHKPSSSPSFRSLSFVQKDQPAYPQSPTETIPIPPNFHYHFDREDMVYPHQFPTFPIPPPPGHGQHNFRFSGSTLPHHDRENQPFASRPPASFREPLRPSLSPHLRAPPFRPYRSGRNFGFESAREGRDLPFTRFDPNKSIQRRGDFVPIRFSSQSPRQWIEPDVREP